MKTYYVFNINGINFIVPRLYADLQKYFEQGSPTHELQGTIEAVYSHSNKDLEPGNIVRTITGPCIIINFSKTFTYANI